uniref:Uncharacterized protein n=1 Tax=Anopheles quadriannulatus TaxID=34691 RepID=A0A182XRA2_ANOQN
MKRNQRPPSEADADNHAAPGVAIRKTALAFLRLGSDRPQPRKINIISSHALAITIAAGMCDCDVIFPNRVCLFAHCNVMVTLLRIVDLLPSKCSGATERSSQPPRRRYC